MKELTKAVFVSLDGALITTKSGRKFPIHSKDWRLIPKTINVLSQYYKLGYKIIIVSNQKSIEEGYISDKVFLEKIESICSAVEGICKFKKNSISYFYCSIEDSYNFKPNPGMALEAAIEYELSLTTSIMIGSSMVDEDFGKECGVALYYDANEWNSL